MKTKLLISDYRLPNQHKPLTINSYFFELENTLKYTYSSIYIIIYIELYLLNEGKTTENKLLIVNGQDSPNLID